MSATCCETDVLVAIPKPGAFQRVAVPTSALFLLCFLLFFFRLADRDLASSHEARAGQDAQSMLNSGEWDLPRLFDGQIDMQKPPLYYWLVGLFGASTAARSVPGACGCRRRCRRSAVCCYCSFGAFAAAVRLRDSWRQ